MNNYTVYKHIFPNKKIYIGITSNKPKYRWNKGKGYRDCSLMYRAIQKYGWENIKHEILFENLSKKEAEQKEIELIVQFKSNDFHYGYNLESGGNCVGKVSKITKEKISKNNARYWKGKKLPPHVCKAISERQKNRKISVETIEKAKATKKEHYPDGYHLSQENILKIKQRMIGNNYGITRKICQYSLDNVFIRRWESIAQAKKELNISDASIVSCAKGRRKSAGGYIWKYDDT